MNSNQKQPGVSMETPSRSNSHVIARLTVTRANGWKTIVTIQADATFHSFYRFYKQCGNRRSTKELLRTAGRAEGCLPLQAPGLELIRKRLMNYQSESNPIISSRLRIIKKRAYKKLLSARPDELGLTKVSSARMPIEHWRSARSIPMQLSVSEVIT